MFADIPNINLFIVIVRIKMESQIAGFYMQIKESFSLARYIKFSHATKPLYSRIGFRGNSKICCLIHIFIIKIASIPISYIFI